MLRLKFVTLALDVVDKAHQSQSKGECAVRAGKCRAMSPSLVSVKESGRDEEPNARGIPTALAGAIDGMVGGMLI